MLEEAKSRTRSLQARRRDLGIAKAVFTDESSIKSLNMSLRKIIKNRGHFPSDDTATKLMYLALRNVANKWTVPPRPWKQALNQFAVLFQDRFPSSIY
jgi:putative transposase